MRKICKYFLSHAASAMVKVKLDLLNFLLFFGFLDHLILKQVLERVQETSENWKEYGTR